MSALQLRRLAIAVVEPDWLAGQHVRLFPLR